MRICCPLVGDITMLQTIFLEKIRGAWLRTFREATTFRLLPGAQNPPSPWYLSEATELLCRLEAIAHLEVSAMTGWSVAHLLVQAKCGHTHTEGGIFSQFSSQGEEKRSLGSQNSA